MRRRSGYGWFELIIGIMLVVLGIFTFIRPGSTLTGIVILYGLVAVITGISDLIFYVRTERYTGFGPAVSLEYSASWQASCCWYIRELAAGSWCCCCPSGLSPTVCPVCPI